MVDRFGERDPLFGTVATPFRIKSFGITLSKFVDVVLRDVVEREAQYGSKRADVPEAITKFLRESILIERCRVEEMFLDDFRHFPGFASEPQRSVGELLFMRAIATKCASGKLSVVVELHWW